MSSRVSLLVARELHWFRNANPWGISAKARDKNQNEWSIEMKAPPGSCWEGMVLKCELYFGENYNETPPRFYFLTVPFHPNIDAETGVPCTGLLHADTWIPGTRISCLLVAIQNLLVSPSFDEPVNIKAAKMFISSPHLYAQLARDAAVASIRLLNGAPLFDEQQQQEAVAAHVHVPKKRYSLSYDSYHESWKEIATSVVIKSSLKLVLNGNFQTDVWYGKLATTKKHKPKVAIGPVGLVPKLVQTLPLGSGISRLGPSSMPDASNGFEPRPFTVLEEVDGEPMEWELEAHALEDWTRDLGNEPMA